jgi:FMN phosphatase YigB (HAD superfamily)
MEELFREVAERYRVGILSDCDPLHWGRVRSMLPWLEAVGKPTLSFEVGYLKPHPEMYAAAAGDCGSLKQECLFIDDMAGNVDGARFCGMQALHFTGADKLRHDLRRLRVL